MRDLRRLTLIVLILSSPFNAFNQDAPAFQVAVFIGLDCPISQKYVPKINAIFAKHGNNPLLEWHFIVPRPTAEKTIKRFKENYSVQFPIESDNRKLQKTRRFMATVTPQAVIIKDGKIYYEGAIDNWFYELGRNRKEPTEHYLVSALESILENEDPKITKTEAIGCFIQLPHE